MLSLGKPCVISDIPGVRWAKQFENTFVFQSENCATCAAALEKAVTAPKILKTTAEELHAQYDIMKWVKAVTVQYEK